MRQEIGPIATPDIVHFAPGLPKTRSGKIMRRILRKIAEHEFQALGDISTLADPSVVEDLIRDRKINAAPIALTPSKKRKKTRRTAALAATRQRHFNAMARNIFMDLRQFPIVVRVTLLRRGRYAQRGGNGAALLL